MKLCLFSGAIFVTIAVACGGPLKLVPSSGDQCRQDCRAELWNAYFIDRDTYEILKAAPPQVGHFWIARGKLIANELSRRMIV